MKCILWNLEWATPGAKRGVRIHQIIRQHDPDLMCLTETTLGLVPDSQVIDAGTAYGYPNPGDRRKVLLWSRAPWTEVDVIGDQNLPPGRYVAGVTGGIRFIGVCIPWRDAHVRTGSRDRTPWQDHVDYLRSLGPLLRRQYAGAHPVCVLGDFNQRIPPAGQPDAVADALESAFRPAFQMATSGVMDPDGRPLIDHIAHTTSIAVAVESVLPKVASDGLRLSDHAGVLAGIRSTSGVGVLSTASDVY